MRDKSNAAQYDVAVIGAGVIGCAIARELSRYDISVAVLEKEAEVAMGSSEANSGLIHAGFDPKPGSAKARFNVAGAAMYPEICRELSIPYKQNGALVVAFDADQRAMLDELLERGRQNGVSGLRIVEGEELRKMEPQLTTDVIAALYAPTGGIISPYVATFAFADDAAANGVEFIRECSVTGIKRDRRGYTLETSIGEIMSRAVVNAAGLYSDEIYNMVSRDKLTITPTRGEYWLIDRALEGSFTSTIFRTPTKAGKGILVTPTVDGTLLIGPTSDAVDDKSDVSTTTDGLDRVFAQAKELWPSLSRATFISTFAGNRAKGDRGDFVVGESEDSPLFFNAAAIESPGLSSAPAIGKYLAELIAERIGAKRKKDIVPFTSPAKPFAGMTDDERAAAIASDKDYGTLICRCESVTEAEIRDSIRRPVGARTVDGVKHRTRAGMGRCQGGFCMPRVVDILSEELGVSPCEITKSGKGSELLTGGIGDEEDA